MDDQARTVLALTALMETFGQEATEARMFGYMLGLKGLSANEVETAVSKSLQSSTRIPSPAELRELIGEGTHMRSMLAWAAFEKAMSIGPYRHVNFRDRVINATVRMLGGWTNAFDRCTNTEETKWYRIEFIKTYEQLAKSSVSDEMSRPLAGLSESTMISGRIAPPMFIECEYVDGAANNRLRIKES